MPWHHRGRSCGTFRQSATVPVGQSLSGFGLPITGGWTLTHVVADGSPLSRRRGAGR